MHVLQRAARLRPRGPRHRSPDVAPRTSVAPVVGAVLAAALVASGPSVSGAVHPSGAVADEAQAHAGAPLEDRAATPQRRVVELASLSRRTEHVVAATSTLSGGALPRGLVPTVPSVEMSLTGEAAATTAGNDPAAAISQPALDPLGRTLVEARRALTREDLAASRSLVGRAEGSLLETAVAVA